MRPPLKLRCRNSTWYECIEFALFAGMARANPITMLDRTESDQVLDLKPTFSLERAEAQSLMDELWHCGLRPTEGTGSAGSLAATQKHLEDMRAIVFNAPKP